MIFGSIIKCFRFIVLVEINRMFLCYFFHLVYKTECSPLRLYVLSLNYLTSSQCTVQYIHLNIKRIFVEFFIGTHLRVIAKISTFYVSFMLIAVLNLLVRAKMLELLGPSVEFYSTGYLSTVNWCIYSIVMKDRLLFLL